MASCGTNTTCFNKLTFPVSKTVWKTAPGSEHLSVFLNFFSLQNQPLSCLFVAAVAVRTEREWVEGARFIKHNLTAKPPKQDASRTAALTSPRPYFMWGGSKAIMIFRFSESFLSVLI